ncbi:cation-translocating P-type ATPase [Candidatus Woesearchaeota archaeon]|nr:cation-translocating P-type ATPase [Candidatus Woesearchaeota archaeon]
MYYQKEVNLVLKELNSSKEGLTKKEARLRLKKYGKNQIQKFKKISALKIFISQFKSFIIYILLAAAILALILGEKTDFFVILIIVILNSILGFIQEFKAEKSIEALKKLTSPNATVIRDNKIQQIKSWQIVPGDILVIEEGAYIPADARLIECSSLEIDESTLTGESNAVSKNLNIINKNTIISNQKNMIFAGTIATRGRGKAVVTETALKTELGKIAHEIQNSEEKETPLQKKLHSLGIYITLGVLLICGIILLLNFLRGAPFVDSILTAVALAVAAIPEGLPAIITITLALGTQRMLKNNALMRRLSAVESLGSVTVICSDKTGTLTKNEMTVTKLFTNNKLISVTGSGYKTEGEFFYNNRKINPKELENLMQVASLCNNATLEGPSDPTEKALLVTAKKADYNKDLPRLKEIPFSSETKYMITLNKIDKNLIYNLKGAPEVVLKKCDKVIINNKEIRLTDSQRKEILTQYNNMASEALRVLGFAYSKDDKYYVFSGLMGMIDPPREEVKNSISLCKKAGIKIIMITGDHAITAKAIGNEIGITGDVITGEELDELSPEKLSKLIDKTSIYARVSPQHKVKILEALKNKGHVVAMTGDGVNDAVALKRSDIGIAVGSGTDVAKQASDMILLDDHFATIVNAIKEGRGIYNNIKKFISYLFSCNLAEVLVIFIALLINLPLPLIAVQILLMNLLTDGLPALALGIDKIEQDVMSQSPRNPKEHIITKKDLLFILFQGAIMTTIVLSLFYYYLKTNNINYAQTVAFSALVLCQLSNAYNYHTAKKSIFKTNPFSNKLLIGAILTSLIIQIVVVYSLNNLFKTIQLGLYTVCIIIGASLIMIISQELIKLFSKPNY